MYHHCVDFHLIIFYIVSLFSDGIMGEVLFWTLNKCLGPEFDEITHFIWVKIISRILRNMVPVAVAYELNTKSSNQKARVDKIPLFHSQDSCPCPCVIEDKRNFSSGTVDEYEVGEKVMALERKYSLENSCFQKNGWKYNHPDV